MTIASALEMALAAMVLGVAVWIIAARETFAAVKGTQGRRLSQQPAPGVILVHADDRWEVNCLRRYGKRWARDQFWA